MKNKLYLCSGFINATIMTKRRAAELSTKRAQLLTMMLAKAGITKTEIYDVALRRWVNANLDLLTPADRREFADVLSL